VFGLSFLDELRSKDDARSPRIIGYLPASEGGHAIKAGLNDFRENRESVTDLGGSSLTASPVAGFRGILHKAIREGLEQGVDDVQANGARQLQEGWMHIHGASFVTIILTHPGLIPEIVVLIRS